MVNRILIALVVLLFSFAVSAHPSGQARKMVDKMEPELMSKPAGDFIRLVAGLDEPEEFYCFDLAGWGKKLKLDDPLQTHTCKKRSAEDQYFFFNAGRIEVTEYGRCVQVGGSSGLTLPGSAVLARPCSDEKLQLLTLEENGTIRVTNTDFCIGAGASSEPASGPSHMWRTLTVVNCGADESLTRWQVGLD